MVWSHGVWRVPSTVVKQELLYSRDRSWSWKYNVAAGLDCEKGMHIPWMMPCICGQQDQFYSFRCRQHVAGYNTTDMTVILLWTAGSRQACIALWKGAYIVPLATQARRFGNGRNSVWHVIVNITTIVESTSSRYGLVLEGLGDTEHASSQSRGWELCGLCPCITTTWLQGMGVHGIIIIAKTRT